MLWENRYSKRVTYLTCGFVHLLPKPCTPRKKAMIKKSASPQLFSKKSHLPYFIKIPLFTHLDKTPQPLPFL